jgi:hypothetical protein
MNAQPSSPTTFAPSKTMVRLAVGSVGLILVALAELLRAYESNVLHWF